MTTAKDVADRLQLSVSTVGRALDDDPRISAATKLRVKQAAAELGYVANRAARMMRGVRSTLIGIVVPDVRNSFYSMVAHAMAQTLRSHDYQVVLCETDDDRRTEARQIRDLAAAQVAGVVIVPTARPHPDVKRLLTAIPHVQFNRRVPGLSQHWFGIDDHDVTRTATRHLLELGHRRIGYIGGAANITTGAKRLGGFRDALVEAGLPDGSGIADLGQPAQSEHGADAFRRLLAAPDPPTAILIASVQMTIGVMLAAHETRIAVPEAVSIVGFGDEPGFAWWGPGMTTMALPVYEVAAACGAWLLHTLDPTYPDAGLAWLTTASRGQLLVRGSTAPPPGLVA